MSNNYSVTVKVTLSVLADSEKEAEELAKGYIEIDNTPRYANVSYDAYFTPNQSQACKQYAVNYHD